jgi:PQQ-like domain
MSRFMLRSPLVRILALSAVVLCAWTEQTKAQSTLISLSTRRGMVFDHAGNHLYISTSSGTVQAYNLSTNQFDNTYTIGSSLNGIDIAADDSFLLVAENSVGLIQGTFYRLDLSTGIVTNVNYTRTSNEGGAWDVAIGSNGLALITTQFQGSGWVPLRQINLANNSVSVRSDAPGSGGGGQVRQNTKIRRSADGTRLYLLESNISNGPLFTYNAVTNSFSAPIHADTFLDGAGAAVNRDGTILGTRINDYPYLGATNASLDGASNFTFIHGFSGMSAGVAFDAVNDTFYTIGNGGTQIIAFDTDSFKELFRLNIGETVNGNVTQFGTGTLVASQDGQYLALETPSGIRLFSFASTVQGPAPTFTAPTDMVFDRSGKYLYIATYDGHVWPYNLVTRRLETPYTCDGSLLGLDIAADDSFLIAAQAVTGLAQGAFQKLDLNTGTVTNLSYTRAFGEAGAWGVAITSNGTAFGTTEYAGSGWVPLHLINFATGTVGNRTDAPGSGGAGQIRNHSQIHRGADRTRLYILESDISSGPIFTYSAVSDTFGPNAQTSTFLDYASAAVNRDGSLLGTHLDGQSSASLDTAPNFNFVHSFNGLDSGVAFDAVRDHFYGVNSATDQIFGYDTNNFTQKVLLQIGENVSSGSTQFGPGTMVASQDGRYLALQTSTAIRVYAIPPSSGPALQVWNVAHLSSGHFIIQAFGAPNSTNSVKATTNLQTTFMTIGSVMADANGFIQFEDTNVGNTTSKFYKITSP